MRIAKTTLKNLMPVGVMLMIAVMLGVAAFGVHRHHKDERHHATAVLLDDVLTRHSSEFSNFSAGERVEQMATEDAFDDFTAAFAQDAECSGLTLFRYTAILSGGYTASQNGGWNFPEAYWVVSLYPSSFYDDAPDQGTESTSYRSIRWDIKLESSDSGLEHISESSKTAREAAHSVCVVANQKAGAVW